MHFTLHTFNHNFGVCIVIVVGAQLNIKTWKMIIGLAG